MNMSQCAIFNGLSHNVWYHVTVAIKGLLCVAGAVRVILQWKEYGFAYLVHDSTKILFRFWYALNVISTSIFGFMYLAELIRLRFECFLLDFRYILLTRCVGITAINTAHQIITIVSLERLYATLFPARFEKNSNKLLVKSIASITITTTSMFNMMQMSNNFKLFHGEQKLALLNERIPENSENFETLMTVVALGNCVSLLLLSIDLFLNFSRKQPTAVSLSVSYQVRENRRIVLTLLPIELTQTIFGIFTSASLVVQGSVMTTSSPIGNQLFLELVTPTAFMPLIFTFFIKHNIEKRQAEEKSL